MRFDRDSEYSLISRSRIFICEYRGNFVENKSTGSACLPAAVAIRSERKAGCLPATNFRLLIKCSSVRPFVSGVQLWTRNCAQRVILHDLTHAGKYITSLLSRK